MVQIKRPFHWDGLTWIPPWIITHMPIELWDEIPYPFQNFNNCTVGVWEWISISPDIYNICKCLSMLGFKLIHVKEGPE